MILKKAVFFIKYLNYRFVGSRTKHGIHSPFVFSLLTNVIQKKSKPDVFNKIEELRLELLTTDVSINVTDLGVGSGQDRPSIRKISEIAKNASKSPKYGGLLYRIVEHFKPKTVLELGTSFGISTLYQAAAVRDRKMITIEGCPETARIAGNNFVSMQIDNIEQIIGSFDEKLPIVLNKIDQLDYVFFDGNHKKAPTLNYFDLCMQKAHNDSVFIFDDIHWSSEMDEAWKKIKANPAVTVTIDLFFMGLVFFRKEQQKQDFVVRF